MFQQEVLASQLLSLVNLGLALMTLSVLLASILPSLNPFLKYGKTLNDTAGRNDPPSIFSVLFNLHVPKKWFTHFYILHFILSFANVCVLFLFERPQPFDIKLVFLMNMVQSSRRLYECIYVSKFSPTAKIHILHYLVGLIFYISISLIPFLMQYVQTVKPKGLLHYLLPISIFSISSLDQSFNHVILSKQKKYTLPNVRLFRYVVCPHYTDECFIYLSIFLMHPSFSFFLVFLWVAVNLSVSANQSYIFYESNESTDVSKLFRIFPKIC